jgi:hypothetical protein
MKNRRGPLSESQWAMFRARMEELAQPAGNTAPATVKGSYFAEVVLLLMDRLDELEERFSEAPATPVVRRGLAALTEEDWNSFLSEYGEYVMDGWDDLRAFSTALGTLLVRLERKQKQSRGKRKRA